MSRIDFIGTGNAFAPPGRLHACLCIDRNILVDLPPTVMPQLRSMGLDASDINHVLITHWHGDHTFGIPFFMLDRRYISDRLNECDLTIYLRPGGQSILTNLCEIGFPGDLGRFIKNQFEWETSESLSLENTGWNYVRFPVHHTPETDPHGYVLSHKSGFRLLHCGDSGPCDEIENRAHSSDAILLEMGMPDIGNFPYHHTPSDIASFSERHAEKKILVTHNFASGGDRDSGFLKPDLPPNVHQLEDGDHLVVHEDGSFEMKGG